jgi:hypothetical protein
MLILSRETNSNYWYMVLRCLLRATLQEILQELCRLTTMSPEEDEYHLPWLKKGRPGVDYIFANWQHGLATHALCKQSMKNRGNAKLLHMRKWQRVKDIEAARMSKFSMK